MTNTSLLWRRLFVGQRVDLRIGAEDIVVTHQGHIVQTMPRLVGKQLRAINYRHIIDSLVRKPGAFANYQYREEMFPTSRDHFQEAATQATTENLSHLEYLSELTTLECEMRRHGRIKRLMKR